MAQTLPLFVELKSVLLLQSEPEPEFASLEEFDPLRIVKLLEREDENVGIIVATDKNYLGGHPGWINLIKTNTSFPVIRQDFFIDPVQVYQSKAIGADGVMINLNFTGSKKLSDLLYAGDEMGLELFLEIDDLKLPSKLEFDLLTGIIVNFQKEPSNHIENLKKFCLSIPEYVKKLIRFFPHSKQEFTSLKSAGFQALVLSDEIWQRKNFIEEFNIIANWGSEIGADKQL
ncbi:MAG: hypothetical protein GWN01_10110, partial [Nitrosopumilaceae archaeon]|nr:hypothetical protein [Nitrosopumilaceae archaeon]NIX61857.1 hypothetical protein [Nitrosopumilaceae archaeon]